MTEEPLAGGNASGDAVVRVGDTVRKPWLPTSELTVAYLDHLAAAGIDVPRTHGRDHEGRLVLDFVPGELAMASAPLDAATVFRVGELVRRIHDASAALPVPDGWPVLLPAPHADLLCHNDLATWNLVIDGDRLVFIDWDGAGPSSRVWDLAYAAISFAHLFPDGDPAASGERLRKFFDGYRADAALRNTVLEALAPRATAMWQHLHDAYLTGWRPWADMYVSGHGGHWAATAEYIEAHFQSWREILSDSS